MPNNVFASDSSNSVDGATAVASTTTYTGSMDVTMGGKTSTIGHFTQVTDNGSDIDMYIPAFKVGKMPGTIEVDATGVAIDGSTNRYSGVVTLKILGVPTDYDAEISVTAYDANTLQYTLNVKDARFLGIPFEAKVVFTAPAM